MNNEDSFDINKSKERQLAAMILDILEEKLQETDTKIPDKQREIEYNEDQACIYGPTYFELEDKITELLKDQYQIKSKANIERVNTFKDIPEKIIKNEIMQKYDVEELDNIQEAFDFLIEEDFTQREIRVMKSELVLSHKNIRQKGDKFYYSTAFDEIENEYGKKEDMKFIWNNDYSFEKLKGDISAIATEIDIATVEDRKRNISVYLCRDNDSTECFNLVYSLHKEGAFDDTFSNSAFEDIQINNIKTEANLINTMKDGLNKFYEEHEKGERNNRIRAARIGDSGMPDNCMRDVKVDGYNLIPDNSEEDEEETI